MRKKYLKHLFLVPLLAVTFYSCLENVFEAEIPKPNEISRFGVADAQNWFETNHSMEPGKVALRNGETALTPVLDWNIAELSSNPDWEVVELPWEYEEDKEIFALGSVWQHAQENGTIPDNVIRLIVMQNRKTGDTYAFKMKIAPAPDYLLQNGENLHTNMYLDRDSELSGVVMFYWLNDVFMNGWLYKDGKIIDEIVELIEITDNESSTRSAGTRSIFCGESDGALNSCVDLDVVLVTGTYGGKKNNSSFSGSGGIGNGNEPGGYNSDARQDKVGGGGANVNAPTTPQEPTKEPPTEPCVDEKENKANPLVNMALAPPVTNGRANIPGATYGNTRDQGATFHNGIDLAGAVGTPIYAQFPGRVTGKLVTEQPNRVDKEYPSSYTGTDRNGAGNRITITSTVNGQTVSNSYWHLQAGTPLANNPRTGQPWAAGDWIDAGEMIGYIGITGNANPNVPHLHLKTTVNGVNTNPANFLNAAVSTTTAVITTPCD